ncbi:MAG: ribosome maturation factor RimM [Clostridiales bacterium]|jgi:16S rRNA processing protein RimM|nr:ribosome maturation factor RimM [Clostridiales bacterium]
MKVLFGTVLKPQGIKGELKTRVNSQTAVGEVFVKEKAYKITSLVFRERFCYVMLDGVTDRNAAELFRGAELYCDGETEILPDNTYYVDDMVGSAVIMGNIAFGTIIAVDSFGAADVITLAGADGKRVRVPHLKKLVLSFNPKDKIMILSEEVFGEVAVYED